MEKKSGEFEKSPIKARWLWLIIPLLIGGCYTQKKGYQKVRDMRQLERIPQTDVLSLIDGEVSIRGKAVSSSNTVKVNSEKSKSRIIGPNNRRRDDSTFSNNKRSSIFVSGKYSGTKCFYCYYKKEKRSEDSDGNESWSTVESGTRHVGFFRIKDSTGDVLVSLDSLIKEARKSPSLGTDYRRRRGDYRWTERRIDIGEKIFVFAMAVQRSSYYELNFAKEGSYSPILSDGNAVSSRTKQGGIGVLLTFTSLVCLSLGVLFLCFMIKIHRILVFLSILSALNVLILTVMGINMMAADIKDGDKRLKRHEANAKLAILKILEQPFEWESVPQLTETIKDEKPKARAIGIRNDYAAAIERNNAILKRFPEKHLSKFWKIYEQESIFGPEEERPNDSEIIKSPMPKLLSWGGGLLALVGGIFGTLLGFRRIKTKRYIENVPTSLSTGLAFGPSEIKGTTVLYEGNEHRVIGPLTKKKCLYYRYKITEERGSGKNKKTVTIEDRTEMVPFLCKDEEGYTRVVPFGAEFICEQKKTKSSGRRTYYEWHIAENQEIYLLGSAVIEPIAGESLQMADGDDDDFPFLISDRTENETMLKISRAGLFRISCGFIGIVTLVLLYFAGTGSYSPSDFILSSMTAPAFLIASTFILMFNDLVFLRNRVKRAHSNIEVSLQKRSELIPNIESAAKSYLEHEKEVHRNISELRTSISQKKKFSTEEIDAIMHTENQLTERMFALAEKYPELKGHEALGKLMEELRLVENEVALMRQGYNDSVELYKTTSQRIPEVFLAKSFGFKDSNFLRTELSVRKKPEISFD
ncbi:MAG TPA: LemA family protein [Verrucomicrobia bacterium]|nr:LemA family protein [Verrucomicrobiales bacterium]HIL54303.1 LemA family protein [Verrucomicrobiota bacterium]